MSPCRSRLYWWVWPIAFLASGLWKHRALRVRFVNPAFMVWVEGFLVMVGSLLYIYIVTSPILTVDRFRVCWASG